MLVLSRKLGETIKIGDNVFITIVDIDNAKVRVGIEAPKSVTVHRLEVAQAIEEKTASQAKSNPEVCDHLSAQ